MLGSALESLGTVVGPCKPEELTYQVVFCPCPGSIQKSTVLAGVPSGVWRAPAPKNSCPVPSDSVTIRLSQSGFVYVGLSELSSEPVQWFRFGR